MADRTSCSRSLSMMLMRRRYGRAPRIRPRARNRHGSGADPAQSALDDRILVEREADRAAHRGDDPEAQDDLRLGPRLQLEVVVDRGHQEDPLPEGLEREDLDQDG